MASLTEKELFAIEDQLNSEQLVIKKLKSYANATKDAQIKVCCEQLAAEHKTHYDTIMGHLCC